MLVRIIGLLLGGLTMGAAAETPVPHPIIVNDDGHGGFYSGRYTSAEAIREKIARYQGTHVRIFEWCITMGSRANYPSQVTEIMGTGMTEFPRRGDKRASELMHKLAAEGVDTLAVVAKACHDTGLECFASIRMNPDYAASWMGEGIPRMFNSNFWWQHPEFRVRGPKGEDRTKLSYAFPEVRAFKLGVIREALERDIDGLNLDFLRHPPFLGYEQPMVAAFQAKYGEDPRKLRADDPRWLKLEAEVMTGFLREVRQAADEAGAAKRRRLRISVRVDHKQYRAWGLDIERWMKDKLIDLLIVAQHSLGGYVFDLRPFVQMARGTGCQVFFGEEVTLSGHDLTPEEDKAIAAGTMKPPKRDHLTLQMYCDRARQWYAQGADGIHLFNDHNNLPVLRILGDPALFPPAENK